MSKPSNIEQLKNMAWLYKCNQSPSIPRHAMVRPKYSDGSANSLTTIVRDFLKMKGHYCGRTNTTGTYSVKLGKYIHSGATRGQTDLNCIVNGRSVQVEIKFGRDKLSPAQVEIMEQVQAAGGIYLIVRSFNDFIMQYQQITGETEAQLFEFKTTKNKQV